MCREKRGQTCPNGMSLGLCHANVHGKYSCSTRAQIRPETAYSSQPYSTLQPQGSTICTETWLDAAVCNINKDTCLSQCRKRGCCRVLYEQKAEENSPMEENVLRYIVQARKRRGTFSKRTKSIIKKAHELSMLTASQVLVLIANEDGRVHTFATQKLRPIITKCLKRS